MKKNNLKVEVKDEWTDGLNMGLDLAISALRKDKSGITVSQA